MQTHKYDSKTAVVQLTPDDIYAQTCEQSEISNQIKIAQGGQATVFSAIYQGEKVAIKEFKTPQDMMNEVTPLAYFRSPHIEPLLGILHTHFSILMPLKKKSLKDICNDSKALPPFSWQILMDITRGLDYTHANGYVHRDIKSANVLVDENGIATLADFGFAHQLSNPNFSQRTGTPFWMAPELYGDAKLSSNDLIKTDIYSLGMLMLEMGLGYQSFKTIFSSFATIETFRESKKNGEAQKIVKQTILNLSKMPQMSNVCQLIILCTDDNPKARPTTTELIDKISKYLPALMPRAPAPVCKISFFADEKYYYWIDRMIGNSLSKHRPPRIEERHIERFIGLYSIALDEKIKNEFVNWLVSVVASQANNQNILILVYFIGLYTSNLEARSRLSTVPGVGDKKPSPSDFKITPPAIPDDISAFSSIQKSCQLFIEGAYPSSAFYYRSFIMKKVNQAFGLKNQTMTEKEKTIAPLIDEYAIGPSFR